MMCGVKMVTLRKRENSRAGGVKKMLGGTRMDRIKNEYIRGRV